MCSDWPGEEVGRSQVQQREERGLRPGGEPASDKTAFLCTTQLDGANLIILVKPEIGVLNGGLAGPKL